MRIRRLFSLSLLLGLALAIALSSEGSQVSVTVASPGAVTVREPAFGLPHIYADTDLELAREGGREIAKDRLGQLILMARVGRGTLYQAFSLLDPSTLNDDMEVRRTGYTSSELNNMFAKLTADMQAQILEYCKGVNDTIDDIYAGTLPEPLEINLFKNMLGLGNDLFGNATNISDQVDPYYAAPGGEWPNAGFQFTPEIAMAIAVLQIRSFGNKSFDEPSRLNELQSLLEKLPATGDEIWDDLNFLNDPLAPVSVPDPTTPGFGGPLAYHAVPETDPVALVAQFPGYDYEAALESVRERQADREEFARSLGAWPAMGSYAWSIDGERSATANPWLGGFPQMGFQTPSIMHFIENRSGEGDDHRVGAIGFALVGLPAVVIGHTDSVAWTSTTAQLKVNDFYLDKLILEKTNSLRYNDEGTPAAVNVRTEQILDSGGSPTSLLVWRTHERAGNGGSRTVEAFQGDAAGTAGSAAPTSLTDADAFTGDFSGGYVAIVGGTGAGQMRPILSNDDDTLTLHGDDAWTTTPDTTSEYVAVRSGDDIVVISRERVYWLEESTSTLGWSLFQRAESILDIRRGTRMMPTTHNFFGADNQAFNGIGTDLGTGTGNIGYWSGGFSRVRQGGSPTDTRLPMDGTAANELVVVSGTVDSATANTLTDASAFAGKDFTPPPYNYRMDNPSQKGSEYIVTITGGAGYRQTRRIASNEDDNTLTLEEDWGVVPSAGDLFEVYEIVAMPEAINPSQGYTGSWNNKAATADDGQGFGREFRSTFVMERLAADSDWNRADQRQLNKDVAGVDPIGKLGRYLVPSLRLAVDGVGDGGNPDVNTVLAALEAHNGSPEFGRYIIDPVTETTTAGEMEFLTELIDDLASAIYGDEFSGTAVGTPTGLTALNLVQHAIDSAAGSPAGRYTQAYSGDYFNGADWRVVVRDTFSDTIVELGGIPSDPPRPEDTYVHPLAGLFPSLVFDPVLMGNRGTWEQIVEVGPVVLGEFIFPLGQSGFVSSAGTPDPNFDSLHSIWAEWRFVPMLHIAEDLATDPDGDVDNDGVLDGFEEWYFGSNSPGPTDDGDGDDASLLDEFLNGLDPTEADTDGDVMPDGFELANACLNQPQARDSTGDPDTDGLDNLAEYTAGADPCDDDTDDDTILDGADDDPVDEYVCQDLDSDTCDDCSVLGQPDTSDDGTDTDSDGACDAGDPDDDDDTVLDGDDTDPLDPYACQDLDSDTCDDCSVTGGPPSTADDGPDNEPDGLCDAGDPDDDNDTVDDGDDIEPLNPYACQDLDSDTCDDCSLTGGPPDTADDGPDNESDGLCDAGDPNDDNDTVLDVDDNCPKTDNEDQANTDVTADPPGDSHGDVCDNCSLVGNEDQANTDEDLEDAGASIVGDSLGDACDVDDDNDGFDDDCETSMGTEPLDNCTCGPGPGGDAWPPDIDMSCDISVTGDVFNFVGRIGDTFPRLDFDCSGDISVTGDIFWYVGKIGKMCT